MEKDFDSVDNVKRWLHFLKDKGNFTCARLAPFDLRCESCVCYCRMVGINEVNNCVLRDIRLR